MIHFEGSGSVNKEINKLVFTKVDKILPADKIDLLVKKLQARAEFEMTDTGSFKPIIESIRNTKPVIEIGDISFNLKSSSNLNNCSDRILDTTVSTKSGQYSIQKTLAEGKREEILKFLKDEKFGENFKNFLMECSDDFEKKGLE